MSWVRDVLAGIGLEVIRLIAGVLLFFFWLPWHAWRTRQKRRPAQGEAPE